jgi:DNA repair protein RecO (recombination protein O)
MTRHSACPALVLRVRPCGESNREAFFLTAETGVIRAYVYGGPKSKLRARVSPFHSGALYLYRDPVRDSRKVTDFDVSGWRPGIRECYDRTMAAAAIAETILAGFGGGCNWPEALELAGASLDALDDCGEAEAPLILLHFLWNWTELTGIRGGQLPAALSPVSSRWLAASSVLPVSEARRLNLDRESMREVKDFCTGLVASALGRRLKSWEW